MSLDKHPQGWTQITVGIASSEIISGAGFPKEHQGRTAGDYPFAKVGDISKAYRSNLKHIFAANHYISNHIREKIKAKIFPKGTIVFPKIGESLRGNYRLITGTEMLFDNNVMGIIPDANLADSLFLYYFLTTQDFGKFSVATAVPSIRRGDIEAIPFLLPPLLEQHRVVAKIEELFSGLDKGVENLRTAQQQLKIYRQALINDTLKAKSHSDGLTAPLSDLIGRINQGWSPKCELNRQAIDGEWAIIKTTAVQPMQYRQGECKPLPENFEPRPEIEIKIGDFLMTRKGPRNRTGIVCLVEATRSKSMFCDTVYRFRCDETKIYPKYLELALNSPAVVAEIDRRKSGISDSGISLNHPKIKTLPIPLVGTITAQKNVVDEIGLKLEKITTLEMEVSQSLLKADALRQSILKKAFSGQLVPQDPNDEPASVLLERIRAERAAQPKVRGRKAGISA